jgi:hypothetical protein
MTVTGRAVAAALASALAGVVLFGVASIRHRHVGFDMNRDIPGPPAPVSTVPRSWATTTCSGQPAGRCCA